MEKYQKSGWTGFVGERLLKYHLEMNNLNWKNLDLIEKKIQNMKEFIIEFVLLKQEKNPKKV